jgi:hypothetical protein
MNCPFCQQPCKEKITHLTSLGAGASNFTCHSCVTFFEWFHNSDKYHKYTIYKDNYIAEFFVSTNRFQLSKSETHDDSYEWKFVLELDFLPDLTPQNFNSKLKTMLILL